MITAIEIMTLGYNAERIRKTILSGSYVVAPRGSKITWSIANSGQGRLHIDIKHDVPFDSIDVRVTFQRHEVNLFESMFPHTNGFPVVTYDDERVFGSKKLYIPRMR